MVTIIAKPIYDIVFKYLLEDERIARITPLCPAEERGA